MELLHACVYRLKRDVALFEGFAMLFMCMPLQMHVVRIVSVTYHLDACSAFILGVGILHSSVG